MNKKIVLRCKLVLLALLAASVIFISGCSDKKENDSAQTAGEDAGFETAPVETVEGTPGSSDSSEQTPPDTTVPDENASPSEPLPPEAPDNEDAPIEDSSTEEPPKEDTTTEEPAKEDTTTEEPPKEDTTTEKPAKEDTTTEEPPKEDTTTEEPAKEDTTTEEPTKEDTSKEEPVKEDTTTEEPPEIKPDKVSIKDGDQTLTEGDSVTLSATVTPSDAADKTLTWSSDNKSVATVNNGVVKAVSEGAANISVKTVNGKTASVKITVKAREIMPEKVSLNSSSEKLTVGDDFKLTASVSPSDASDKSVTYSSSAPAVASVNASGTITALTPGTAVITVTAVNGVKATVSVTVKAKAVISFKPVNYEYYYSQLKSQSEKDMYRILSAAFENSAPEITDTSLLLDMSVDPDRFTTIFNYVRLDHPEFFHVKGQYSVAYLSDVASKIILNYNMTASEYKTALTKLDEMLDPLYKQGASVDEYERALLGYNYVTSLFTFDTKNAESSFYVYSAINTGKAVCEAYSGLYSYILGKFGINSLMLEGESKGVGHQWVMAQIDGKWYHFDPTWDDPVRTNDQPYLYLNYFALNGSMTYADHNVPDPSLFPSATALDANYFVHNGLVITSLDADSVAAVATKSEALTGHIIFNASQDVYDALVTDSKLLWQFVNCVTDNPQNLSYSINDAARTVEIFY